MNEPGDAHVVVEDLTVSAVGRNGMVHPLVEHLDLKIARGRVLALIGESGSGKTTVGLSLLGYARPGSRITSGRVMIDGVDIVARAPAEIAQLRGNRITYVAQSAAAAFNPVRRLIDQVIEPALIRRLDTRRNLRSKAIDLFRAMALPEPEAIGQRYPHELSGGQLQRVMAAMALITDPELIIFDEPTSALDMTTQVEVLHLFKTAIRRSGATAVFIAHDMGVVAQVADSVAVLKAGRVCELQETALLIEAPRSDYTRALLASARPALPAVRPAVAGAISVLEVRELTASFDGRPSQSPALRGLEFSVAAGGALGILGESGSGKSTLAKAIVGLVAPLSGEIRLNGVTLERTYWARNRDTLRRVQIAFQNADVALNPAHSVTDVLGRVIDFYHRAEPSARRQRLARLLDLVQLPAGIADRNCAALSGGQKQRLNLARALAAEPDLLICDEVTSGLDPIVREAIVDLLQTLRTDLSLGLLFISHDVGVVRALCDEVAVLYEGAIVQRGAPQAMAENLGHPYARRLVASVPPLEPGWLEQIAPVRGAAS